VNGFDGAPFATAGMVLHPSLAGTAGEVELMAFVPGPAGTSRTDVHDDVSVEVDFAEPDRLCTLFADDVGASRSLELLIGRAAYRSVRTALLSGDDRSRRVGEVDTTTAPGPRRSPSGPDRGSREFGFSVAARAVGDDPYEPALVRATAYMEAASWLLATPWSDRVDMGGLEEQLVFAAETMLDDLGGEQVLARLDLPAYERLREAVLEVVRWPPWAKRPWAQELAARLSQRLFVLDDERRRRTGRSSSDMALGLPMLEIASDLPDVGAAPMMRFSSGSRHTQTPVSPAPEPTVERLGPGRYVYRFTRQPKGAWLRLIDARSQVLVALVPIKKERSRFEAHVVLPTSLDLAHVVPQPTATPIVGSASTLDTMLEAVDHGRAAARLSAAGDPAASDRWHLCARRWNELGDASRAGRAVAYATGREWVTRPPFVHDSVRDVSE
jgi:hypothetical protein